MKYLLLFLVALPISLNAQHTDQVWYEVDSLPFGDMFRVDTVKVTGITIHSVSKPKSIKDQCPDGFALFTNYCGESHFGHWDDSLGCVWTDLYLIRSGKDSFKKVSKKQYNKFLSSLKTKKNVPLSTIPTKQSK